MACLYEMGELGVPFEKIGLRGALVEKVVGRENRPWGEEDVFSQTLRSSIDVGEVDQILRVFYTLRVCKGCRANWLDRIKMWFRAPPNEINEWNNDSRQCPEEIDRLLARAEALRVELVGIEQRLNDTVYALRVEHAHRKREAARPDDQNPETD
jgi:hypothetical protein